MLGIAEVGLGGDGPSLSLVSEYMENGTIVEYARLHPKLNLINLVRVFRKVSRVKI